MGKHNFVQVEPGIRIDYETGLIVREQPFFLCSQDLYYAKKGDTIRVKDESYLLGVATYGLEVPQEYMYTYMYEPEHNWSVYEKNLSEEDFSIGTYVFQKECYFRVLLKKKNGTPCTAEDAGRLYDILRFRLSDKKREEKDYFIREANITADTVCSKKSGGESLVFGLLTDSHATVNGTWKDTVHNLAMVNKQVGFDGIIHLGDLHDGILSKKKCRSLATEYMNDLRSVCEPLYQVIGNHDTNYFNGNPEWLTEEEQHSLYGSFMDDYVTREGNNIYYYVDYDTVKLRMIFLSSFNHLEPVRYGFPREELDWLTKVLGETEKGYKVLVFSHDAPLARLDYWANEIRSGEELTCILERFNEEPGHTVLGYIHGHTHADYIYTERNFPIISVGCSKCEYFPDKKPEGSVRQMRKLGDVTQDLWDVLIVKPRQNKLEFVRFGAGEDRTVLCRDRLA